ncbi:MAG: diacylglycerol kinase [Beijerinckiaceae bacterium]|nr:diacylglycerol kinase [Beijerinckiaceae bacterium]
MLRIYKAFLNSCRGFSYGLRTERAIQQEFVLLIVAIPLALWLGTTGPERLALVLSVVAVLCVEFLNTAIEKLCDHVTPAIHPQIKAIKDMASSACLCVQASAVLVWLYLGAARFF